MSKPSPAETANMIVSEWLHGIDSWGDYIDDWAPIQVTDVQAQVLRTDIQSALEQTARVIWDLVLEQFTATAASYFGLWSQRDAPSDEFRAGFNEGLKRLAIALDNLQHPTK